MLNAIPKKCQYALRAVFQLARTNHTSPVTAQQIAAAQAIPVRFLEVILAELRHAGILESRRGSDGGYLLARPANELTVAEVISCLEDKRRVKTATSTPRSDLTADDVFARMWDEAYRAAWGIYTTTTFEDIVEEYVARRARYVPNYAI